VHKAEALEEHRRRLRAYSRGGLFDLGCRQLLHSEAHSTQKYLSVQLSDSGWRMEYDKRLIVLLHKTGCFLEVTLAIPIAIAISDLSLSSLHLRCS
jgi:hypothetical protein